ncbi:Aste57867_22090 [Aphanomyces stellatus]|uniref:Aste57867_22090 protein n=1 Tax=Aphanomyces stellatus TaxID=120398 RepID=A0A485LJA8_9STRA|nr:hypothetical protein As57867_022021 [Aphanomyces stellatus]VFT98758.1 Aste57867_22090 [Aphanomyces stellatus]
MRATLVLTFAALVATAHGYTDCPAGQIPDRDQYKDSLTGTFSVGGQPYATKCPEGTFSDVAGASTCVMCPPGPSASSGSTACTLCNPGTFSTGLLQLDVLGGGWCDGC